MTENNYVNTTRVYLKNYSRMKIAIANKTELADTLKKLLAQEPAAQTIKYDDTIHSTNNELTSVESSVARRESDLQKLQVIENDILRLTCKVNQVERALNGLNDTDKHIITAYYIQEQSWRNIAQSMYVSERSIREKANIAVRKIAEMIFGTSAMKSKYKNIMNE